MLSRLADLSTALQRSAFLQIFLPHKRCRAIASGDSVSEEVVGVCLFADLSGFTPLMESLTRSLGAQQGVEVLTDIIN